MLRPIVLNLNVNVALTRNLKPRLKPGQISFGGVVVFTLLTTLLPNEIWMALLGVGGGALGGGGAPSAGGGAPGGGAEIPAQGQTRVVNGTENPVQPESCRPGGPEGPAMCERRSTLPHVERRLFGGSSRSRVGSRGCL